MKKFVLALCLCALVCSTACKGSSADSSSDEKKSETTITKETDTTDDEVSENSFDDSDVSETDSIVDENDDSSRITENSKYDPVVVNEGVDNAVKVNSPETANISGYYNFTYNGFNQVYSNDELQKCFDKLAEICNNSYFSMAFSYSNMDTGASIDYNQYKDYPTCSTIKAPFIKSLLANGINLDDVITKNASWDSDSGTAATAEYGTDFTAKQLIEYTIKESDNTAYLLLDNYYGYSWFNSNQYTIGSGYYLGSSWIFTYSTSLDMMKNYTDIYKFAENSDEGKWLVELMSDTKYNQQIGKALGGKYTVAQKYGADHSTTSFNDCAIVYADSPFVLTIMTEQVPETEESCQIFKDLAVVFDDINSLIAQ